MVATFLRPAADIGIDGLCNFHSVGPDLTADRLRERRMRRTVGRHGPDLHNRPVIRTGGTRGTRECAGDVGLRGR